MEQIISTTPIVKHFADLNMSVPGHFNQSVMLKAQRRMNMFTFKASLSLLCQYHDMLHAKWNGKQLLLREVNPFDAFYLEEHNMKGSTDVNADILPLANRLQSTIDLTNGPLMHVAVFHLNDTDAILFAIHHLVVDGVSWRILVEDLNKIYTTLLQGKLSVRMPKRRYSFAQYADAVNEYAKSEHLAKELPYWTETVQKVSSLNTPHANTTHEYGQLPFCLDEDSTRFLTGSAVSKYNADINSLLLSALLHAWKTATGNDVLSIAQEGHGREPFPSLRRVHGELGSGHVQTMSLERLVGWFTTIFPVALTYTDGDIPQRITSVDNELHNIPNKGFGYGVLRHIAGHENLSCNPLMTFNYLGSFDESMTESFFTIDTVLPHGESVSHKNNNETPLSINCAVGNGCLTGALSYDKGVMSEETAKCLLDSFVHDLQTLKV